MVTQNELPLEVTPPSGAASDECKDIEELIEEKVSEELEQQEIEQAQSYISNLEPSVLRRLPQIIDRETQSASYRFSGPLPPQVINNLTPEQKDKLIDDMVNTKQREQDNERDFIRVSADLKKDDNNKKQKRFYVTSIVIVIIFAGVLYKDQLNFIKEFVPLVAIAIGGYGFGTSRPSKKQDDE